VNKAKEGIWKDIEMVKWIVGEKQSEKRGNIWFGEWKKEKNNGV
jgi:hypothetical protein